MDEKDSLLQLKDIIAQCDKLCAAGDAKKVGEFLRMHLERVRQAGDRFTELSLLSELMGHYRLVSDRENALDCAVKAVALLNDLRQTDTVSGGTIMLNAATVFQAFGNTDMAEKDDHAAWDVDRKLLEEDDWRFAGLYNNMASVYIAKGDFRRAENLYLEALDLMNSYGRIMDCATTYANLAQLSIRKNARFDMIQAYLDCAMQCFNNPAAARDGYYAHTCGKCAEVFFMAGRESDGEELLARMEEIYAAN